MKHLFLAVALAATLATTASASVSYAYTTSASYTASGADPGTVDTTSTCTGNTVNTFAASYCVDWGTTTSNTEYVLAYADVSRNGVANTAPGTNDTFGYFQLFCYDITGSVGSAGGTLGTNCGDATMTGDFTITVNQTTPASFVGTFTDSVVGNFTADNAGTMFIDFSGDQFTAGSGANELVYTMEEPPQGYGINIVGPPASDTSVQGNIESTPQSLGTPEPATFALIGGALGLLGMVSRRKRA
jgi:hypothetical protein